MKKQLIFLLLILPLALLSQETVVIHAKHIDFGTIEKGDNRIQEFQVENISKDSILILKMELPSKEYSVRFSTKKIAPKAEATVRLKYNPKEKGAFGDKLIMHFSTESIELKTKGKANYLEWADFTPCPDFDKPSKQTSRDFDVHFLVVDSKTREPLDNATIKLTGKVKGNFELKTNKKGEVTSALPIDHYDIKAERDNYGQYAMDTYINSRNRDFTLALLKGKSSHTVVKRADTPEPKPEPEEEVEIVIEPTEIVELEPEETVEPEIEQGEFSSTAYKANNVVFLIDVSTSMRKEDRMDMLKSSMISLTEMLRPSDKLSIITYASRTEVVMSGEAVTDRAQIIEVIEGLEGKGLTGGEAGVKKAYTIAKRHYIDGGNNQVYLATDGAFNKGSDAIAKLVRKEARKGTNMSVLAIRGSKWSRDKMRAIAKAGKGDYLIIDDMELAAQELKTLVKRQSAK